MEISSNHVKYEVLTKINETDRTNTRTLKTLTSFIVNSYRRYYRYWTGYYGLPVAGWNAGDDGKSYLNIKG